MKLIQCSRCGDKVLVLKEDTLPDGWHKTSDLPDVGASNIAICPPCYSNYLRARKQWKKQRNK